MRRVRLLTLWLYVVIVEVFTQISKEINTFQLKPEGGSSVSNRAGGQPGAQPGEPPQVAQVLHIPVDQKVAPHDLVKVGDNMVSTQVISGHHCSEPDVPQI